MEKAMVVEEDGGGGGGGMTEGRLFIRPDFTRIDVVNN